MRGSTGQCYHITTHLVCSSKRNKARDSFISSTQATILLTAGRRVQLRASDHYPDRCNNGIYRGTAHTSLWLSKQKQWDITKRGDSAEVLRSSKTIFEGIKANPFILFTSVAYKTNNQHYLMSVRSLGFE